jgi:hypothetical protein
MTPEDIAYLRSKAQSAGYNAGDILKMINYESSGRENVWGGKGNKYFGLFQAGPSERKQFGVDTVNPTASNQIDALFKFLPARGFRPGMGLLDLYSTINAGSPGHYSASDGNGTVASHVARMGGDTSGGNNPMTLSGGVNYAPEQNQESSPKNPLPSILAQMGQKMMQPKVAEPIYTDADRQSMHNLIHRQRVAGLLGE